MYSTRPGKRVVRFGYESVLCSVRINFGLSPFGSGMGSDRVKFGLGSISGQSCSGRVWVRFGWSMVRVYSGGATETQFWSGMGWVYFGSGEIRFKIWVNIGSGVDLTNGSFGSGSGRVFVRFGSTLG